MLKDTALFRSIREAQRVEGFARSRQRQALGAFVCQDLSALLH
jgi:hypothetical protein